MSTELDVAQLRERAAHGDADAQCELGRRLLAGRGVPLNPKAGVKWIEQAAERGSAAALLFIAMLKVRGVDRPRDIAGALSLLAQAGDASAAAQLTLLSNFDADAWLAPSPPRLTIESPRVGVVEGFLPPAWCASLVALAEGNLERAKVTDTKTGAEAADPNRTNTAMAADLFHGNVIVQLVKARIGAMFGVPLSHQEEAGILHYSVGQKFGVHVDYMDPRHESFRQLMANIGQRDLTFLIYLNDAFEGGETDFPLLNWRYRGGVGDALFFWNVDPAGAVETRLEHAGLPPTSGEKWLFSQWIRSRPIALI
jgi:prolyl 4-hydroxylase